jgi:hypothetical protein
VTIHRTLSLLREKWVEAEAGVSEAAFSSRERKT